MLDHHDDVEPAGIENEQNSVRLSGERGHGLAHTEPPTEVGQVAEAPTEVVPPPTDVGGTAHAWAEAPEEDQLSDVSEDRRPLPTALMVLLVSVVLCGIGLGAYVIGEHVNRVYIRSTHAVVETLPPQIGPFPVPPNLPPPTPVAKPTTTVAIPTPTLKIQPRAWEAFTYLLDVRGLSIDADEKDYDDKANRRLCMILDSNSDPAFHQRTIQKAIEQSEGGTWGAPEATYAIHAAVMAYCPQFDKGFPSK